MGYGYSHNRADYCPATAEEVRRRVAGMERVRAERGRDGAIVTTYRDADGVLWEHTRGRDFTALTRVD